MTLVTRPGATSRPRPMAIVVDRSIPLSEALSPALSSGRPLLGRHDYEHVHDLSPGLPPEPTSSSHPTDHRGQHRISNHTFASSMGLDGLHNRRHSLPATLRQRRGPSFRSPRERVESQTPSAPAHWLRRVGPFEMGRAVAPIVCWWGAYALDHTTRQSGHPWPLAVGSGLLITAGTTSQWQLLIEAVSKKTADHARTGPFGRGPSFFAKAYGVAAPVAQIISALAYFRGRFLGNRAVYEGGLWGSVFSVALGHYTSLQLLERLPRVPLSAVERQGQGAQVTSLLLVLTTAAALGMMQASAEWEEWRSLLAISCLVTAISFLSLRNSRLQCSRAFAAAPSRPVSQSTTELLERSNSERSVGGDHFVARIPPAMDEDEQSVEEPSHLGVAL